MSRNKLNRYIHLFALCLLLFFPNDAALARLLGPSDYDDFHKLTLRMRPIGFELSDLIIKPPGGTLAAATRTQDCMIRLSGTFDTVDANFKHVTTLVGLASKMIADEDETLVILLLRVDASGFVENLKNYRRMLNNTAIRCSDDGATVAKSQEISRVFDDASSLIESILNKIGGSKDDWRGLRRQ